MSDDQNSGPPSGSHDFNWDDFDDSDPAPGKSPSDSDLGNEMGDEVPIYKAPEDSGFGAEIGDPNAKGPGDSDFGNEVGDTKKEETKGPADSDFGNEVGDVGSDLYGVGERTVKKTPTRPEYKAAQEKKTERGPVKPPRDPRIAVLTGVSLVLLLGLGGAIFLGVLPALERARQAVAAREKAEADAKLAQAERDRRDGEKPLTPEPAQLPTTPTVATAPVVNPTSAPAEPPKPEPKPLEGVALAKDLLSKAQAGLESNQPGSLNAVVAQAKRAEELAAQSNDRHVQMEALTLGAEALERNGDFQGANEVYARGLKVEGVSKEVQHGFRLKQSENRQEHRRARGQDAGQGQHEPRLLAELLIAIQAEGPPPRAAGDQDKENQLTEEVKTARELVDERETPATYANLGLHLVELSEFHAKRNQKEKAADERRAALKAFSEAAKRNSAPGLARADSLNSLRPSRLARALQDYADLSQRVALMPESEQVADAERRANDAKNARDRWFQVAQAFAEGLALADVPKADDPEQRINDWKDASLPRIRLLQEGRATWARVARDLATALALKDAPKPDDPKTPIEEWGKTALERIASLGARLDLWSRMARDLAAASPGSGEAPKTDDPEKDVVAWKVAVVKQVKLAEADRKSWFSFAEAVATTLKVPDKPVQAEEWRGRVLERAGQTVRLESKLAVFAVEAARAFAYNNPNGKLPSVGEPWSEETPRQVDAWLNGLKSQFARAGTLSTQVAAYRGAEGRWFRLARSVAERVNFNEPLTETPEERVAEPQGRQATSDWMARLETAVGGEHPGPDEPKRLRLSQDYYGQGLNLLNCRADDQAAEKFSEAIRLYPKDARYYYFRAIARYQSQAKWGAASPSDDVAQDMRDGVKLERANSPGSYEVAKSLTRVQGSARTWVEAFRGPGHPWPCPGVLANGAASCTCGKLAAMNAP